VLNKNRHEEPVGEIRGYEEDEVLDYENKLPGRSAVIRYIKSIHWFKRDVLFL
jgi:hypothetical protein